MRAELLRMHQRFYVAPLMALCVSGRQSVAELEALVSRLFVDVPTASTPPSRFPGGTDADGVGEGHPLGPNQVGKMLRVVPIKDIRAMGVIFAMPDLLVGPQRSAPMLCVGHETLMPAQTPERLQCRPDLYAAHLIGHEGPGRCRHRGPRARAGKWVAVGMAREPPCAGALLTSSMHVCVCACVRA